MSHNYDVIIEFPIEIAIYPSSRFLSSLIFSTNSFSFAFLSAASRRQNPCVGCPCVGCPFVAFFNFEDSFEFGIGDSLSGTIFNLVAILWSSLYAVTGRLFFYLLEKGSEHLSLNLKKLKLLIIDSLNIFVLTMSLWLGQVFPYLT